MIRKQFFNKRSLFIILLASSTANPLLAIPLKSNSVIKKRNIKTSKLSAQVQNTLVNKGLEKDVASLKIKKLFSATKNFEIQLNKLINSPDFSFSKEKLEDTLAKYALQERKIDLNSYSGVLGLMQSVTNKRLDEQELKNIEKFIV